MSAYEDLTNTFSLEKCKLLTTEEEYKIIKSTERYPKYKYIASCGHENIVFLNVFKNRKTGVLCPSCVISRNKNIEKNKYEINEKGKIEKFINEFDCIQYFKNLICIDFDIIKAFDCCKADIILKPKNVINDEWIGIQVKSTKKSVRGYGFHLENDYKDFLILFICNEDKRMWLTQYNNLNNITKVSIGYKKSKYNCYEVFNDTLIPSLTKYYQITKTFNFDYLNTPINKYQQREQKYRNYRKSKINFLDFEYDEIEGTVYDFKIDGLKVQEKVFSNIQNNNNICIVIEKNNGKKDNGKKNNIQYDIGDNDVYWFNFENSKLFFVVPELILIEKNYIGNSKKRSKFSFSLIKKQPKQKNNWIHDYCFNYDDVDKEKLLKILLNIKNKKIFN